MNVVAEYLAGDTDPFSEANLGVLMLRKPGIWQNIWSVYKRHPWWLQVGLGSKSDLKASTKSHGLGPGGHGLWPVRALPALATALRRWGSLLAKFSCLFADHPNWNVMESCQENPIKQTTDPRSQFSLGHWRDYKGSPIIPCMIWFRKNWGKFPVPVL